jgi:hypothetical protein
MVDIIDKFGRNAGKIWAELNKKGSLEEKILLKKTRLKEEDFYAAIGWLAREDKICYTQGKYHLSPTNLTEKIGGNAGKLYTTLINLGEINVSSIAKISKIQKKDAYSAIGWLAREDKISPKKKNASINSTEFKLK